MIVVPCVPVFDHAEIEYIYYLLDCEQDSDGPGGEGEGQNNAAQMLLFSATMPGWICKLTDKHMQSPVFLDAVQVQP